jgi:hypothetical protein
VGGREEGENGGKKENQPKRVWAAVAGERGDKVRVWLDYKLSGDDAPAFVEVNPNSGYTSLVAKASTRSGGGNDSGGDISRIVVVKEIAGDFYAFQLTSGVVLLLTSIAQHNVDIYRRVGLAYGLTEVLWTRDKTVKIL